MFTFLFFSLRISVAYLRFLLTYVKGETDVHKKQWLSGHGLFGSRPADTVRSLPSEIGLVDTGLKFPSVDSGRQHPSTPIRKEGRGQIGLVDTGLKSVR